MPPPLMTLLALDPSQSLVFASNPKGLDPGPSQTLTLINKSSGNVAFKVKTTAPKSYVVRPSSGLLKSNESSEVQIILQPSQEAGSNNHRFLVQAVGVSGNEAITREAWEALGKEEIEEKRLNVVIEDRSSGDVGGATSATKQSADESA